MLESNNTLTELNLEPPMSFTPFKLLAYALRVNTCLESFRVSISGSSKEADLAIDEIATVLGRNSTLKSLWNLQHSSLQVSNVTKNKILNAIEQNTSLEVFLFFEEDAFFSSQKEQLMDRKKQPFFVLPGIPTFGDYMPSIEIPNLEIPNLDRTQYTNITNGIKASFESHMPSIEIPNLDTTQYTNISNGIKASFESLLTKTKAIKFSPCQSSYTVETEGVFPFSLGC
jgi:hypothetical protein